MNRKKKRQQLKRLVEKSIVRDEEKQRIKWSASSSTKEVLLVLHSSFGGLDEMQIQRSRMLYGRNEITFVEHKDKMRRILESLVTHPTCSVIRKMENEVKIPRKELVVGDIVQLQEGDEVPADLRVLYAENLMVNQKPVTGEDTPAKKDAEICRTQKERVADYENIMLMGTFVIEGTAQAIVLSVGDHTMKGTLS